MKKLLFLNLSFCADAVQQNVNDFLLLALEDQVVGDVISLDDLFDSRGVEFAEQLRVDIPDGSFCLGLFDH